MEGRVEINGKIGRRVYHYAAAYPNVVRVDATEPMNVVCDRIKDALKVALHLWGKS